MLSGSAFPGLVRDRALERAEQELGLTEGNLNATKQLLAELKAAGGAGNGDGYTRLKAEVTKAKRAMHQSNRSTGAGEYEPVALAGNKVVNKVRHRPICLPVLSCLPWPPPTIPVSLCADARQH